MVAYHYSNKKGNPKETLHCFQSAALVVPSHTRAKYTLPFARWKHHANRSMQSAGWRWCFPDEGASHLILRHRASRHRAGFDSLARSLLPVLQLRPLKDSTMCRATSFSCAPEFALRESAVVSFHSCQAQNHHLNNRKNASSWNVLDCHTSLYKMSAVSLRPSGCQGPARKQQKTLSTANLRRAQQHQRLSSSSPQA